MKKIPIYLIVLTFIFLVGLTAVESYNITQLNNIVTELKASNEIQRGLLTYSISADLRAKEEKEKQEIRAAMQKEADDQAKAAAEKKEANQNQKNTFLAVLAVSLVVYTKTTVISLIDNIKDSVISKIIETQWRLTTISFGWYLLLPWTKFPNKNKIPRKILAKSIYHKTLFDIMVLGKKEKILCETDGKLGYIGQFDDGGEVQANEFLDKLFDICDRYYPDTLEFDQLREYWKTNLKGITDVNLIYIVQCSMLSMVNRLDPDPNYFDDKQLDTIFGIIWENFIESAEVDENNITEDSLGELQEKLAKVLNIKFNNPLYKAYTEYVADQSDQKKRLRTVLQSVVIDIYNKSKNMAEIKAEKD